MPPPDDPADVLATRLAQIGRVREVLDLLSEETGRIAEGVTTLEGRFLAEIDRAGRYAKAVTALLEQHRATLSRAQKQSETVGHTMEFASVKLKELLERPEQQLADPTLKSVDDRLATNLATLETSLTLVESQSNQLAQIGNELDQLVNANWKR